MVALEVLQVVVVVNLVLQQPFWSNIIKVMWRYRIWCISVMYGTYVCSLMLIPRQLRFSLYSGAVITEGRCSLFTSLLSFLSWPCPMPYAWILASCSMGSLLSGLFLDLAFPSTLLLWIFFWGFSLESLDSRESAPGVWDFPFYLRCPPIELWDRLSSLLEPWDSVSGFPELWLARCIVG